MVGVLCAQCNRVRRWSVSLSCSHFALAAFFFLRLKKQQHLVSSSNSTSGGCVIGVLLWPAVGSSAFNSPFVELTTWTEPWRSAGVKLPNVLCFDTSVHAGACFCYSKTKQYFRKTRAKKSFSAIRHTPDSIRTIQNCTNNLLPSIPEGKKYKLIKKFTRCLELLLVQF